MLPGKWLHQLWKWRDMQEKMLQIAANMKKLKNIAMEDFVSNCAYEELE